MMKTVKTEAEKTMQIAEAEAVKTADRAARAEAAAKEAAAKAKEAEAAKEAAAEALKREAEAAEAARAALDLLDLHDLLAGYAADPVTTAAAIERRALTDLLTADLADITTEAVEVLTEVVNTKTLTAWKVETANAQKAIDRAAAEDLPTVYAVNDEGMLTAVKKVNSEAAVKAMLTKEEKKTYAEKRADLIAAIAAESRTARSAGEKTVAAVKSFAAVITTAEVTERAAKHAADLAFRFALTADGVTAAKVSLTGNTAINVLHAALTADRMTVVMTAKEKKTATAENMTRADLIKKYAMCMPTVKTAK